MKKLFGCLLAFLCAAPILCGCGANGDKSANISVIYLITAISALALLAGCWFMIKNRNRWILLLFASVTVINAGYYWLSVSPSLTQALLANGVAYFGSAFLPVAMLMIILRMTKISYKPYLPIVLGIAAFVMFLIAASPIYPVCNDIYYKTVEISKEQGVTVLVKEYGSLHILYTIYLLGSFAATIAVSVYATVKNKLDSAVYAMMLNFAVLVNIVVWLMEQFIDVSFEILSVSYIVSELFLLGLFIIIQQQRRSTAEPIIAQAPVTPAPNPPQEQLDTFKNGVNALTHTEKAIFDYYLQGKTTKEILVLLNITENTLKFHNKNLYGKLGVSSRKQLIAIAKVINE